MLIRKDKRAVIFKLRDPSKITTVVPTAKVVMHKGQKLVAVPHRPDETRVLHQLGFDKVPDPLPVYYGFSGGRTPFAAQVDTARFASMNSRCFILNSMGLGKTLTVLWAYDYVRSVRQVRRVLVVCPLSTMERTWADEVFKNFPHLTTAVLYGSAERRRKLLAQDADIYVINTDGLKTIEKDLAAREDIDLIILDEVALYRNQGTERWKVADRVCNKQVPRRVWGLTGSPIPNAPTDAYAQCKLVVPTSPDVPKYFSKFRDLVMRQISQFKWVPREDALETVRRMMQPSIRYSLDDVLDLPEQIHTMRDVQLSPEQTKAYKEMLSQLVAEYAGGQIMAVNEAVKQSKLVQIACGVAYDKAGDQVVIPAPQRIELVRELIEESEGKVIVFVPLTGALEHLRDDLAKDHDVEVIHGGTPKAERDRIFHAFQNTPMVNVLVANPATMSHGLTLTAATTIVWFAPINSNEVYTQACARVRRPGQKRATVIAHIAATEIERRMYRRLENKESTQNLLLDMMKELMENGSA